MAGWNDDVAAEMKPIFEKVLREQGLSNKQQSEYMRNFDHFASNQGKSDEEAGKDRKTGNSTLGKIAASIGNVLERSYKQEIDIKKDIEDVSTIASELTSGVLGLIGTFLPVGKAAKFAVKGLDMFGGKAKKSSAFMDNFKNQFLGIGDAFDGVKDALKRFGNVAIDELMDYNKAFEDVSRAGAGFGSDLLVMKQAMGQLRMTTGDFTKLIQRESQDLAGIGFDITGSVKQLAVMTNDYNTVMKDSYLGMKQLGFSEEELNDQIRRNMVLNRRADFTDAAVRDRQLQSVTRLGKEMDAVSRLTGIQREELQRQVDEQRRLAEVEATIQQMDMDGSRGVGDAFNQAVASVQQFGPGAVTALREIFTQGVTYSEEGQQALSAMGSAGNELVEMALKLRQGGDPTNLIAQFGGAMMDRMSQADFLNLSKMGALGVGVGNAAGEMITSGGARVRDALFQMANDPAYANMDFAERYAEAQKKVKEAQDNQIAEQDTTGKQLRGALVAFEDSTRTLGTSMSDMVGTTINEMDLLKGAVGLLKDAALGTTNLMNEYLRSDTNSLLANDEQKEINRQEVRAAEERAAQQERMQQRAEQANQNFASSMAGMNTHVEKLGEKVDEVNEKSDKPTTEPTATDLIKQSLQSLEGIIDKGFAKIGVDLPAHREDLKNAMLEWLTETKSFLKNIGIDTDKILQSVTDTYNNWMQKSDNFMQEYFGFDAQGARDKMTDWYNAADQWAGENANAFINWTKSAASSVADQFTSDSNEQYMTPAPTDQIQEILRKAEQKHADRENATAAEVGKVIRELDQRQANVESKQPEQTVTAEVVSPEETRQQRIVIDKQVEVLSAIRDNNQNENTDSTEETNSVIETYTQTSQQTNQKLDTAIQILTEMNTGTKYIAGQTEEANAINRSNNRTTSAIGQYQQ